MESGTGRALPAVLTDLVSFLLQLAVRQAEAMGERSLADLDLSGREYGVLAILTTGTSTAQHRLGSVLGMDRTSTAALVGGLERRGLVHRVRRTGDRRAYAVSLSEGGPGPRQSRLRGR